MAQTRPQPPELGGLGARPVQQPLRSIYRASAGMSRGVSK